MKLIEVPIYNDDGGVELKVKVSPSEAQSLLQFALNFMTAQGFVTSKVLQEKKD